MTRLSRIFLYLVTLLVLLQVFTLVVADEFDEEELVNSQEPAPEPFQETFNEPVQKPKPLDMPLAKRKFELSDFHSELFMIGVVIAYLINYFTGKRINDDIAKKWMGTHFSLFKENFVLVGIGSDEKKPLTRDGPADFLFYLSGRRNCQFVHGRITLKPRHNLVQTITNMIISQFSSRIVEDTVTFNVYMNPESYDDFIFAITKKEHSREFRANRYDLSDFTKQISSNFLPNFYLQTESSDITETFLTKQVVELVKKSVPYLNAFIVTDQPRVRPEKTVVNQPKLLTVVCSIPEDLSKLNDTLFVSELIMYLIDFIPSKCAFRIETNNKLKKNREESEKVINRALEAERQEAIQQKKAEKKRAEAERVARLSPDEQRKYEEKERKRELKKKQKKLIKRA